MWPWLFQWVCGRCPDGAQSGAVIASAGHPGDAAPVHHLARHLTNSSWTERIPLLSKKSIELYVGIYFLTTKKIFNIKYIQRLKNIL